MKIEDIYKEWEKDYGLDQTNLTGETQRTPKLHNKYFRIYLEEGMKLRKMREEYKKVKQDRFDWYIGKLSREDIEEYSWGPGPDRNYLKQEAKEALDADKLMVDMTLKIGMQEMKVEYLESIIRMINNRGFQIKNMIDWERFRTGSL